MMQKTTLMQDFVASNCYQLHMYSVVIGTILIFACAIQAEYNQYVRCMGSDQYLLTPMPLEDFCILAGKGARGLPVFNT